MKPCRRLACLTLAMLGAFAADAALAQARPFTIGLSQAFERDSNLFRSPDGTKDDDVISATTLLGGLSLPVSRQRFFADGLVRHQRFFDNDQLDNTGYGFNAGVDWETAGNLSGTVSYAMNKTLASFTDDSGPAVTTGDNNERNRQFLGRARLGIASPLAIEGSYTYRERDYSATSFAAAEFDQYAVSLGLLYRPSGTLTLGVAGRATRGEFPKALGVPGAFQDDEFDRNDVDLTAVWTVSGLSKFAARLSYSNEDHDLITQRDFSGVTSALTWEYKPTGKVTFTTDLIRDTGTEASFNGFTFGETGAVGNNAEVSNSAQVRARYEATAKVIFTALARYTKRELVFADSDKTGRLGLGASYAPTRGWLLGCDFAYEKRGGQTTTPYDVNVVGCSARFRLE